MAEEYENPNDGFLSNIFTTLTETIEPSDPEAGTKEHEGDGDWEN